VIPQKEFRSVLVDNKKTVPEKGSVKLKTGHNNIEIVY
jgi:tRNA threonylcarbamoyladenosine modification (KEOPS) complex  Pcc1 subunit